MPLLHPSIIIAYMIDPRFSRFEAQLERLVEGAFAQLFTRTIRAQDIVLHLLRALESEALDADTEDGRPLAPDAYLIRMNPEVHLRLAERQPALSELLADCLVELAAQSGYRLARTPEVQVITDPQLAAHELAIYAYHSNPTQSSTAVMERVDVANEHEQPPEAMLIIKGEQVFRLTQTLVTIGRSRDNTLVLDDPHVSRHHAQLRLRFGAYTLFDTHSQSGTFVNDVAVREHRLQPNDVILIGKTRMLYLEDEHTPDQQTSAQTALE